MHIDSNQFSKREQEVIKLLLRGKSNKQIALELGISNRTVEYHLSNVYAKLGVNSRAEAILMFTESPLRESAGDFQVESTVAGMGDSTENGFKSTLRRIAVKKPYLIIAGVLTIILITVLVILELPTQHSGTVPETSAEQITATSIHTQVSAGTVSTPLATQPINLTIPPHTVNGYTASIESYYADTSHIIFQVRITGGNITFGNEYFYSHISSADIYDEDGELINTSGGWGPAIDPVLYNFEFVPVTLFTGDHIKGQFAFDLTDAPAHDQILARFRFDFDIPIYSEARFYPKQTVTANGLEIFVDSVTVTPTFTQIYLCFASPSFADWNIGNQSVLQMDGQEATPNNFRLLFDSAIGGDRRAGSEPYWVPPIKNGRCLKSGFPIGSSNPTSITLTIPQLEKSEPDILLTNQLSVDYPGLNTKQAYYTFLEEHGYVYKGPWIFTVNLTP